MVQVQALARAKDSCSIKGSRDNHAKLGAQPHGILKLLNYAESFVFRTMDLSVSGTIGL